VLTLGFAGLEVLVGLISGSLALVADAGHMLVDSAGLVLALAATLIARKPADLRRTFGYVRAEVLVVPLHVFLMLGIAGFIVYEAVGRIGGDPEIDGLPVLVVGVAGLAVNLVTFRLLHGHGHTNLNARGATLEVAADALGSVGVIASAAILLVTGWTGADVVIGLAIGALVVPRAISLLRHALSILLESAPRGTDLAAIQRDAQAVPGVNALHDLHVWSLAPSFAALSAHVEMDTMDGCELRIASLAAVLLKEHGIGHVTLQPETRQLHEEIACCLYPDAPVEAGHDHRPRADGFADGD
jgi:cobalt-zinc-cadmium efflux system protein